MHNFRSVFDSEVVIKSEIYNVTKFNTKIPS